MIIRRLLSPNLIKAGVASGWVLGGRVMGLGWTMLLIFRLGLGDYGAYAMAYAVSAMIAAPIDNIFLVRSLRVDEETFRRERATRMLVGAALLLAGAACFTTSFIVGFALIVAGGEISFNSYKSSLLRDGHPNVVMRFDAIRQAASIVLGAIALFVVPEPTLGTVVACYSAPYLVVLVLAAVQARGSRPARPGDGWQMLLLWLDAGALAVYLQGDVLLIGLITDSEVAGAYSVTSVIALAATAFAQMFVQTYHERLRVAGGDPAAGPRPMLTLGISGLLGVAVLILGLIVLAAGDPERIGTMLLGMSVFVVLHAIALILTTILYLQRRDGHRVLAGWVAVLVKLGLLALLAGPVGLGGIGAVIACIAAEVVLVIWYIRVVLSWRPSAPAAEAPPVVPPIIEGGPA